jgi:uncharacterized membrane protein YeaQ/YmgE (transglycosylase-associated protein family)
MGLIVLLTVGGVLGWLGSIVFRREDSRSIIVSIAAGMVGSAVAGALVASESVFGGISANALLLAFAAAVVAVVVANFVRFGARSGQE